MNIIITGAGRNKGIGAEVCRYLSESGNNIYFTSYDQYDSSIGGISPVEYELTEKECRKYGNKVYFGIYDLSSSEGINALYDDAGQKLGSIDGLVNCLCFHANDTLGSIREEDLDANYQVNTKAIFLLCQEFFNRFSSKWGSIVNLSSMQHLQPLYDEVSYAITKAAVPIVSSTLALQMAEKNISINSVNPGATDTGIEEAIGFFAQCREANPFGRVGKPRDVANIVGFLLSDKGHWITGQTIDSEGAIYRGITEKPF